MARNPHPVRLARGDMWRLIAIVVTILAVVACSPATTAPHPPQPVHPRQRRLNHRQLPTQLTPPSRSRRNRLPRPTPPRHLAARTPR